MEIWTVQVGETRMDWTGTQAEAERIAAQWNAITAPYADHKAVRLAQAKSRGLRHYGAAIPFVSRPATGDENA